MRSIGWEGREEGNMALLALQWLAAVLSLWDGHGRDWTPHSHSDKALSVDDRCGPALLA